MYYVGFALLPWMWFVCFLNFREKAFRPKPGQRVHPDLKMYVWRSWVFSLISFAIVAGWIALFQSNWRDWGEFGKSLLVVPVHTDNW